MTRDKEDLERRFAQLQTNHTALQEDMRRTQEDMRCMQAHMDDVSMQNNRLLAQVQRHRQPSPTPVQCKESWEISHKDIVVTEEKLGHGGWGEVYVGTYFKQRVAVKKLHNNIEEHFTSTMVEEINTMSKLRHPNLLQFIGAVIDGPSQSGSKMLVTEIMDMSLRAAYKDKILTPSHRDRPVILSIMHDVAVGLNYLHSLPDPIIHRDVSSANVLLESKGNDRWKTKISDFGSAKLSRKAYSTGAGALVYSAPESFPPAIREQKRRQTTKMDVYSYGIVLCEILNCEFPKPEEYGNMIYQIGEYYLCELIESCVEREPENRPSMEDVLQEI